MGTEDYRPENEDINIGGIFAEMAVYYRFSHHDMMRMPWATFLMYLETRNTREIKRARADAMAAAKVRRRGK